MSHTAVALIGAARAVSSVNASTSLATVGRRVKFPNGVYRTAASARFSHWRSSSVDASDEERVSSTDNATVKHFAKLVKSKTHRDQHGSVVVAGATLLTEIYENGGVPEAKVVFLGDDAVLPNGMRANRVIRSSEHVLKKAAGLQNMDRVDVVAELETPEIDGMGVLDGVFKSTATTRLLALDGIQDPGNLGTLTRTALALGWDAVALLPGTCDPFNDKALRAARGGVFRLPIARLTWDELERVTSDRGLVRYCAEPTAPNAVGADVAVSDSSSEKKGICLVLGSEGQGLSDTALKTCKPVAIPMPGEMESLNVGIAGGILMYLMRK